MPDCSRHFMSIDLVERNIDARATAAQEKEIARIERPNAEVLLAVTDGLTSALQCALWISGVDRGNDPVGRHR
jgi:hypothetical protein